MPVATLEVTDGEIVQIKSVRNRPVVLDRYTETVCLEYAARQASKLMLGGLRVGTPSVGLHEPQVWWEPAGLYRGFIPADAPRLYT